MANLSPVGDIIDYMKLSRAGNAQKPYTYHATEATLTERLCVHR